MDTGYYLIVGPCDICKKRQELVVDVVLDSDPPRFRGAVCRRCKDVMIYAGEDPLKVADALLAIYGDEASEV